MTQAPAVGDDAVVGEGSRPLPPASGWLVYDTMKVWCEVCLPDPQTLAETPRHQVAVKPIPLGSRNDPAITCTSCRRPVG